MTRRKARSPKLDRLTDALVEDILEAPDAELLAEALADDDDGAARAQAALDRAGKVVARRWSVAGKSERSRRRPGVGIRGLDPKAARRRLDEFIAGNPETAEELAEVAQKGGDLSDEDVYGVLEALQERGMLERPIEHDRR